MSNPRHLDPRAQVAIVHLRAHPKFYSGAILPRNLAAVLPKSGDRRSWKDAVAVFLLAELLSVHRVAKGKQPYWRGALYQVNRADLARRFACDPDAVSTALQWLKELALVEVIHRTRIDDTGKPCGTMVFAVPNLEQLYEFLDYFAKNKRALTALDLLNGPIPEERTNSASKGSEVVIKAGSARLEEGGYLNCVEPQQKLDAEVDDEAFAQGQSPVVNDDRGRLVVHGGGASAADTITQTRPRPSASAAAPLPSAAARKANPAVLSEPEPQPKDVTGNGCVSDAPLARWTPANLPDDVESNPASEGAWRKACQFCALWAEAIVRQEIVSVCKPTPKDRKTAFGFFLEYPQTLPFYTMAVALNAWLAAYSGKKAEGYDKLFHCRRATEIKQFITDFTSSKLESEIGRSGWKINAYKNLRWTFTASELQYFGWTKKPVLAIDVEELWENQPETPDYYLIRKLPLPAEVATQSTLNAAVHD